MHYYDFHTHTAPTAPSVNAIISLGKVETLDGHYQYSVGVHPMHADLSLMPSIREWASLPEIVAIGECGLDRRSEISLADQAAVFRAHIELSEKRQKPLIIHCVRAWSELLALQKEHRPQIPWIVHGFRGGVELANKLLSKGICLSFGRYHNVESLKTTFLTKKMLAETDDSGVSIKSVYNTLSASLMITESELTAVIDSTITQLGLR
jgi:TatD DNase family protein